jgi:hypothetical protein
MVDIDGKNAHGQRVSLLNPESPRGSFGLSDKRSYSAASAMHASPRVTKRHDHSAHDIYGNRSSCKQFDSASALLTLPVDSSISRSAAQRETARHLERMYSTGSASTNSSISTHSGSTASSGLRSYDSYDRSLTPPTPELMDHDTPYDDPDTCTSNSPYPSYPARSESYGFHSFAPIEPALHTRLLDLTVRSRSGEAVPVLSSPQSTTLPSFGQAFSDYVMSPHSQALYDREAHNTSPKSPASGFPQQSLPEYSQRRPSLRVDIQRSLQSASSHGSQTSPATPGASSDDSLPKSRPQARKSVSSRSASSATRGPSDRHRYPCPLADEYDCRSYFTTSGHASRHAKKHTGKRDAECPECHRCFTRKDNMEQHRRTHSKEGKSKKKIAAANAASADVRKRTVPS